MILKTVKEIEYVGACRYTGYVANRGEFFGRLVNWMPLSVSTVCIL
jgi:hypothetical protein